MNSSKQSLQSVNRKVSNMLSRGVVSGVKGTSKTQSVQLSMMADESRDNLEYAQEYGFTSHPHAGAEAVAGFFGGNKDHGTVIKVFDKRYRPTNLAQGEVCLFDDLGTKITLKRGNVIEIVAGTSITIQAPEVHFTGNLQVDGNITCNGEITDGVRSISGDRTIYNSHTHPSDNTPPDQPM